MKCSHQPSHTHSRSLVSPVRIWGNSQWMTAAGVPDGPRGEAGCPVNGHNRYDLNRIENQDQKNYIMGQMPGATVSAQDRSRKLRKQKRENRDWTMVFFLKVTQTSGLFKRMGSSHKTDSFSCSHK